MFIFLFISVAVAIQGLGNCNRADAALFSCVDQLADINHDGRLDRVEIQYALDHKIRYPAGMTVEFAMQMDLNQDGYIDMTDWLNSTRLFYKDLMTKDMACFFCRQNGVNMDSHGKRDTRSAAPRCDTSDERLFECISTLADANKDRIITKDELADALKRKITMSFGVTADSIMRVGDVNHDGVLTKEGDWDNPNRKFYTQEQHKQLACTFCEQNGVSMSI